MRDFAPLSSPLMLASRYDGALACCTISLAEGVQDASGCTKQELSAFLIRKLLVPT